jgi:ArsR family transcriptional regulator
MPVMRAAFREGIGCVVMSPDQTFADISGLPEIEVPPPPGDPDTIPWPDGDLVEDGVCVVLIAEKLKVTQPTATEHLKVLADAGLVTAKRIKQWTFYRRDEEGICRARETVLQQL